MSDSASHLRYDPRIGPDRQAWLGAPEAERTLAVRRWLRSNDLPYPCCVPRSADEWREVEDQLASGSPPETTCLMESLLARGVERMVALWAMTETLGSRRYRQLVREAGEREAFDLQRLFDENDLAILRTAFEASAGGFGPAHEKIIDYYHDHFDPEGSMPFAVAAGFCFGCAASPKFVRNHTLYEHMFGNEIADETPVYLPVADAYRELFRFVSDAVFEQDDPIPPSARPPADPARCFDSSFADWCRGFMATRPVVAAGWEEHLAGHPNLYEEYLGIVDKLRFFASRDDARRIVEQSPKGQDFETASRRVRDGLDRSVRRLFELAHPITNGKHERD